MFSFMYNDEADIITIVSYYSKSVLLILICTERIVSSLNSSELQNVYYRFNIRKPRSRVLPGCCLSASCVVKDKRSW